ncbi:FAD-binding domain-containing protein [Sporormia fimetaria CBS 119925]|uniref:FAD-binding domain-containing protein n=1 Tax=Sporormia fimetaria CBS 119925 TaxID=1340428 RepID=A0A6A6V9V1_9PLEO|nr:FAD-binding domain-containing protein [Sporormia fimetaria CBS 119925]
MISERDYHTISREASRKGSKNHGPSFERKEKWHRAQIRRRSFWLVLTITVYSTLFWTYSIYTPTKTPIQPVDTSGQSTFQSGPSHTTPRNNYICTPSQPCWPSPKQWHTFNRTIGGKLHLTVPWAQPCFNPSTSPSKHCHAVASNYMNSNSRTQQYGSMEFLDWEMCGKSSCILNSFEPFRPVSGECALGRLSPYYVDARNASEISRTLGFAREHGIRLSIKNTGHDYFGRSSAANSLALWTHNMKKMAYHEMFRSKHCKKRYTHVGVIGAGVQAQEAWEFFEKLGMMVTVGAVGSVGIAGGFGQGGGHGPLSPKYGMMVDQAIEFDVVTADGQLRTINECTEPDLFWAMRGGGGGTFAVLVAYMFQLHPAVPINVYSVHATFNTSKDSLDLTNSSVHKELIHTLAQNQPRFADYGIAGYNFLHPHHFISLQVHPSSDTSALKRITEQYHDFLSTHPSITLINNTYHTFPTFSSWHAFTETPSIAQNGPVGLGLAESSRLLPKHLFSSQEDIQRVTSAILTAMQTTHSTLGSGVAHLYATAPYNHPDNSATGLNPAWREAMWHVVLGGMWTSDTTPAHRLEVQNTISAAVQPLKEIIPESGAYVNEGDWREEDWKNVFFGGNYKRLEEVKRKWDPESVFRCWKCIGWTGWDDPMYECYQQGTQEARPSVSLGRVR